MLKLWGRGEDGQLGLGDTSDQYTPTGVDTLKDHRVIQVACGSGHTVVLTDDGAVRTWGRGDDGRLGHGDNGWKYVPRIVTSLMGKNITQVTCGSYHTAAVSDTGDLYTWGGGMYGKLGHGSETGHSRPSRVEALSGTVVTQIACGSRHTVALTDTGDVYSWGDNESGVSGHSDTQGHQYLPLQVSALDGKRAIQVAACGFHTAALLDTGALYSWGEGKFGRLGHGDEKNRSTPTRIASLASVRISQVACGGFHSAAVADNGALYSFGGGEHGQLGHGDKVNKTTPCLVAALSDVICTQVTCGWSHTVVLTASQQVLAFGNGDHGKLGHGDTLKLTVPTLVESLEGLHVCQIASYNEHTAAITDPSAAKSAKVVDSSLLGDLKLLVNNADYSDVTFIVEGRPLYAHRAMLAVRSDHFRAMFASGMRESRAREIKLHDISYATFKSLLEYIYTDSVDVSADIAIELHVAADLYTMTRLKTLCESRVQAGLTVANAAKLLATAHSLSHTGAMREMCLKFVVRHFDAVSKTEAFADLSRELIIEILQSR